MDYVSGCVGGGQDVLGFVGGVDGTEGEGCAGEVCEWGG